MRLTARPAFALLLGASSLFCAGAAAEGPPEVKLGEPFELRAGEKVSIEGGELVLTFVAVTQDSRCPPGEQCIAAGKAVVRFEAAPRGGQASNFDLETGGSASESSETDVSSFRIRLIDLSPRPGSGKPTISQEYLSKLTVHRL